MDRCYFCDCESEKQVCGFWLCPHCEKKYSASYLRRLYHALWPWRFDAVKCSFLLEHLMETQND